MRKMRLTNHNTLLQPANQSTLCFSRRWREGNLSFFSIETGTKQCYYQTGKRQAKAMENMGKLMCFFKHSSMKTCSLII